MIERETGWKRERDRKTVTLGERESHSGKKRKKHKGRRDREKKVWQTVWTVGERERERELQIER